MKNSFSSLPRPLIVGSLRHKTVEGVICDIKKSEEAGAKAFILHIQLLDKKYRVAESFRQIAAATECPIMALNYSAEGGPGDQERIAVLREAIGAGFRSVDIPMNMYDADSRGSLSLCDIPFAAANPREVSMAPGVIEKQKALIKEFKGMGAEVLVSVHAGVELSCEQAVSLGLEIRSRGADIVKIVSSCESKNQQLEILRGNLELAKSLDVPFLYTCGGNKYSRAIRFNAPFFGTMPVFGHYEYGELSNKEKPLIKDLTKFYELMEGNNESSDNKK